MSKIPPLFLCFVSALFVSGASVQHYETLYAPIIKDSSTSLFFLMLNQDQKFVIDINAPFSWQRCNGSEPPVLCSSPECYYGRKYSTRACLKRVGIQNYKFCDCEVAPFNPFTQICSLSQLTEKSFSILSANPKNQVLNLNRVYVSCAPNSLFKSLPVGVSGLVGLSWAPLAFSTQFTPLNLGLAKKFTLCLPSSDNPNGVVFFGNSSHKLPHVLSTDLLRKVGSPEYFIFLTGLAINGKQIKFMEEILQPDNNGIDSGVSGVIAMLSTSIGYTTLRSDIYKVFLNDFLEATKEIPRVKEIYPFNLCLETSSIGLGKARLNIPTIDVLFKNGKNWTFPASNTMKTVGHGVSCLAIVDGGKNIEPAIVIGSYQMENTLVEFDLTNSKLGVTSALEKIGGSCNNF